MADFEELKNELIKSYQDLLELQYHEKPKAREHIKIICESLIADMVLWKIQEQCMDVDVSVGVQLDIIGKWVDIDRYFKGNKYENNKWYAYYDWDEKDQPNCLQGGMWDWDISEKPNNAPFLNYDWILVIKNKLNDDDFRTLIKLKIIKNNTNATCKNIDDEIYKLFKGVIYTVWGEKLFDKSKFTVVGSPTITDDGVASGFSSSNYVKVNHTVDFSKTFIIEEQFTTGNSIIDESAVIISSSQIPSTGGRTEIRLKPDGSFRIILRLYDETSLEVVTSTGYITTNTNYKIRFAWNGSYYTLELSTNNSTFVQVEKMQSDKQLYATSGFDLGIQNIFIYNGSLDLKQFTITADGKEVFNGVKDKVMELTYKYPENQTSIMNLAKTKNCLPCPSGVHLKMEGIPDNE